jgi:hypothetical protein
MADFPHCKHALRVTHRLPFEWAAHHIAMVCRLASRCETLLQQWFTGNADPFWRYNYGLHSRWRLICRDLPTSAQPV